ncbi:four-helix bundle copper-binding protein, partial [Acinetobacter baumannii]
MSHEDFRTCIEACYACAAACDRCAAACLQEEDVKMMARCIATDADCATICRTAAALMARGSEFTQEV